MIGSIVAFIVLYSALTAALIRWEEGYWPVVQSE